jgi:hypothetical protein
MSAAELQAARQTIAQATPEQLRDPRVAQKLREIQEVVDRFATEAGQRTRRLSDVIETRAAIERHRRACPFSSESNFELTMALKRTPLDICLLYLARRTCEGRQRRPAFRRRRRSTRSSSRGDDPGGGDPEHHRVALAGVPA